MVVAEAGELPPPVVHVEHVAHPIHLEDADGGLFDQGSKTPSFGLELERLLLALGDVVKMNERCDGRGLAAVDGRGAHLEGAFAAHRLEHR
ncbi:MAG TPA: hypothetical protein VGQ57_21795, partial [Polyangiaceae bacterium]|nr:hypothetical protein [Polyangiaceae bacterium]